ncbi:phosphate ABC transporter permease PstA [Dactylosporangium sp. CA-139066]|uniref:phosphate ABC transporter permease PstA n=1 Tax=Dactylosporangium sp. CA-139066 TaxID=3239930 RepID=UPI003D90532E
MAVQTLPRPTPPGRPPTSLDPAARISRRKVSNAAMTGLLTLLTAATVGALLWVLGYVALEGLQFLGPEFLTNTPPGNPGDLGGGFLNGIIGSIEIVGIATVIAVPLGVGAAVFIVEYGGRIAGLVGFLTDVLVGLPTIVTGAFIYAIWVVEFGFSGIAGAISLALVMLPLVIRSAAEMLRLVPRELREASLALGITQARTITSVVLPTARAGIITGVMLAVARAMGETAPLLLTALGNDLFIEADPRHRMSTLSLQIFGSAITGYKSAQARAWAGALTLIALVLLFTIAARLIGRASRIGGR